MEKIRYIVRAREDGSTLTDFLAIIHADPALEVVDTIGPEGHPHTAVVAVGASHAPAFEQRFSQSTHLLIERDRPLSLFDKTAQFLRQSERNSNAKEP